MRPLRSDVARDVSKPWQRDTQAVQTLQEVEPARIVKEFGISIPIAEALLDDLGDAGVLELCAPMLADEAQRALQELSSNGHDWRSEPLAPKVMRDQFLTLADGYDDNDNPYNLDGSEVAIVTQSFVRQTVRFIPVR